ncbi:hypothetical protein HXX76_011305 [Chlamydomonas incerta]|uniref:Uncharacterized protein n=1 Tax=Chlamydomonas incerta TaxID=51695 RepID=A0A835SZ35_CHLIN|nr:hypothetical protein HXX76_011305 [Chlamydomonas incerta]|eukprot:KAG2429065.1 hypothetical protein HXX76_011305 [Chlamydomonas incerta]
MASPKAASSPSPSPKRPPGAVLLRLKFQWPLSFSVAEPATEFDSLAPDGHKLAGISYSTAALVAHFTDGSYAYREGGGYSWSQALPLSQYIDPVKYPLQSVSGGSLHFAGVTKKGRVVSSKSRGGDKAVRLLDVPPGEPAAVVVVAGAFHAAAVNEAGGLMVWSVDDSYSATGAVAGFTAVQVGAMPLPAGPAGQVVVAGAPRVWRHPALANGRVRVTALSAGVTHTLIGLSDGNVWVAGIKASERFSRNSGISTIYIKDVQQVKLPVKARTVTHVAAGDSDVCVVATNAGVVCWMDDRTTYSFSESSGWSATYAPAPRHLPELDGVEIKQLAVSKAYHMVAALAADGRIFTWCVALSEKSWPADWLRPGLAATVPGAAAIGWAERDLYVTVPEGSGPEVVKLGAVRPDKSV